MSTSQSIWRACKASLGTLLAVDTAHTVYYLHQLSITDRKDKGHAEAARQLHRSIIVLPFLSGLIDGANGTPKSSKSQYRFTHEEIKRHMNDINLVTCAAGLLVIGVVGRGLHRAAFLPPFHVKSASATASYATKKRQPLKRYLLLRK